LILGIQEPKSKVNNVAGGNMAHEVDRSGAVNAHVQDVAFKVQNGMWKGENVPSVIMNMDKIFEQAL
jgi:hypothetical protein